MTQPVIIDAALDEDLDIDDTTTVKSATNEEMNKLKDMLRNKRIQRKLIFLGAGITATVVVGVAFVKSLSSDENTEDITTEEN